MESSPEKLTSELTGRDLEDREDFRYLLSIMEKQGAAGITQPSDYKDAINYRDGIQNFTEKELLEGSITKIFDDIIFDFDGVICDSTYSIYRALELTLEREGSEKIPRPATVEELANSYQAPYDEYYKRFDIYLDTPERLDSFKALYREAQTQVNNEHHTPAALYPEAKSVLDKIKEAKKDNPNLKVHIISSGAEKTVKDMLAKNGIISDFDEIHTECQDKTAMIRSITEKAVAKERTVMVGDLPSDIKDAQTIDGVKTIAVARGTRERERLGMYFPDYIVDDLNGLMNLNSYSKELRDKE